MLSMYPQVGNDIKATVVEQMKEAMEVENIEAIRAGRVDVDNIMYH